MENIQTKSILRNLVTYNDEFSCFPKKWKKNYERQKAVLFHVISQGKK